MSKKIFAIILVVMVVAITARVIIWLRRRNPPPPLPPAEEFLFMDTCEDGLTTTKITNDLWLKFTEDAKNVCGRLLR